MIASVPLLSSCQEATTIGAISRCDIDVEATATDAGSEVSPPFKLLKPGERRDLRQVPEGQTSVWVGVRLPGGPSPELRAVRVADLAKGSDGSEGESSDFYFEITECPG